MVPENVRRSLNAATIAKGSRPITLAAVDWVLWTMKQYFNRVKREKQREELWTPNGCKIRTWLQGWAVYRLTWLVSLTGKI
jgi:hypothetical protein|tara:strand:+ start:519 stop:761 length:243 start_codon:yes stop_codon:yes gene_type:complete